VISEDSDTTVLDLVDHLLTKGVMITGDVVLGVAKVDLVYLRVSAILCAADRMLPGAEEARAAVRVRPAP
jgi:hypothetical protein